MLLAVCAQCILAAPSLPPKNVFLETFLTAAPRTFCHFLQALYLMAMQLFRKKSKAKRHCGVCEN